MKQHMNLFRVLTTLRMRALLLGVLSACFWAAALLVAAWLTDIGLAVAVAVFIGIWAAISIPVTIMYVTLIVDAANYALSGRILLFPRLYPDAVPAMRWGSHSRSTRTSTATPAGRMARLARAIVYLSGATSPLAFFGMWCLTVLVLAPRSAWEAADSLPTTLDPNHTRKWRLGTNRITYAVGSAKRRYVERLAHI